MKLLIVPVTPFMQNCSVLVCEHTGKAVAIDPGGDLDRVEAALRSEGATLEKVFLTHGHIDHCGQAGQFAQRHRVPIEGPQREDRFWIEQLPSQGKMFGFPHLAAFEPDRWPEDGDTVTFGESLEFGTARATRRGVIFFHAPSRLAIVGDVLFQGSTGRTDSARRPRR